MGVYIEHARNFIINLCDLLNRCFLLYVRFFFPFLLLGIVATSVSSVVASSTIISNNELNFWIIFLFNLFVHTFFKNFIYIAISQVSLGLAVNWKEACKINFSYFAVICLAQICTSLWIGLGFLIIVPGIIFIINCSLIPIVILVEGLTIRKAWAKSEWLVKGYRWQIFFGLLALTLFYLGVKLLASYGTPESVKINMFLFEALDFAVTPIFLALVYFDLRNKKVTVAVESNTVELEVVLPK
jgi:hypothetical protein